MVYGLGLAVRRDGYANTAVLEHQPARSGAQGPAGNRDTNGIVDGIANGVPDRYEDAESNDDDAHAHAVSDTDAVALNCNEHASACHLDNHADPYAVGGGRLSGAAGIRAEGAVASIVVVA